MSSKDERFVVIHGHFYQPPRENPWTEAIERQDSASPYHDWNDRIAAECYHPNGFSRILSPFQHRIANIVNNYTGVSFNFGPTLLTWLESHSPEAYQRILEADSESVGRFSGHGNAIAQAYNHMILPLANDRDRVTQVRWGIADFKHRFGREPESMWLPETAVNEATLHVLQEHGIRYLILSPHQAQRARPLDAQSEWKSVENGEIDTSRPYRCFVGTSNGPKDRKKFVDIFFYHGDLSRGVGFEHLLRNAEYFADRIEASFPALADGNARLVSIATDGESYGHHEPFGDMGLAYLLNIAAPQRGLQITNYGEYLERFPPRDEVELKPGPNGEGTAWSCFHGVGRWYRDCGCSSGGHPGWNQGWRRPLRAAFDALRDELAVFFEKQSASIFKDPWAARDGYIDVILHRAPESVDEFFVRYSRRALQPEERVRGLKLLEMQRQAMLMYTSCGWFFDELSGIETVQVIQYAARAVQLAESIGMRDAERLFIARLKAAKSNIPDFRDGKRIYARLVKPSVVDFPKVVSHFAIRSLFEPYREDRSVYHYTITHADSRRIARSAPEFVVGTVQVQSGITFETGRHAYVLVPRLRKEDYLCWVKSIPEGTQLSDLVAEVNPEDMAAWNGSNFTLLDMLYEDRQQIMDILLQKRTSNIVTIFTKIFERHRGLMKQLRRLGLGIPEELRIPAKQVLSKRFKAVFSQAEEIADVLSQPDALAIAEEARLLGLKLESEEAEQTMTQFFEKGLQTAREDRRADKVLELERLLKLARDLGLNLPEGHIQDMLFDVLQKEVSPAIDDLLHGGENGSTYSFVNALLRLAYQFNFDIHAHKQRLEPLEERLSQDPSYWP